MGFFTFKLGGRFGYFLFFSCSGRGKGESEAQGGGGGLDSLLKIPQAGEGLQEGEGRGGGRVSAANWGIGGGAKYFLSGPKCPPRLRIGGKMFSIHQRCFQL